MYLAIRLDAASLAGVRRWRVPVPYPATPTASRSINPEMLLVESEQAWKGPRNILGVLLLGYPFGLLSVFMLDDPNVGMLFDIARHYIVLTAFLYPVIYFFSNRYSKRAYINGAPYRRVFWIGMIPLFTGMPIVLFVFLPLVIVMDFLE